MEIIHCTLKTKADLKFHEQLTWYIFFLFLYYRILFLYYRILFLYVRRFWTYRSNKFLFIFILMFDEVNDEKACDHNLKLRIRITYSQQHGTYHLVWEIWLRFGADFVPHARACSFLPDSLGKIEKRIETLPLCSPNSRHNYSMDLLLARCIQP